MRREGFRVGIDTDQHVGRPKTWAYTRRRIEKESRRVRGPSHAESFPISRDLIENIAGRTICMIQSVNEAEVACIGNSINAPDVIHRRPGIRGVTLTIVRPSEESDTLNARQLTHCAHEAGV